MTGSCCFCSGSFSVSKRSAEHILPQWLLRCAGVSKKDNHSFEAVTHDGIERKRVTPAYSHTYRRVCASCNSGWLSLLEFEAKRIVEKLVTEAELRFSWVEGILLTAWLFKIFALTLLTEGSHHAKLIRSEDLLSLHRNFHPEGECYLTMGISSEPRAGKINLHFFNNRFITSEVEAFQNSPAESKCFVGMLKISDLLFIFGYVPPGKNGRWELTRV